MARRAEHGSGTSLWFYGDAQFSPPPLEMVADRFARAFPGTAAEDTLTIGELEIYSQISDLGQWFPSCSELFIDCLVFEAVSEAVRRNPNVLAARLSGTFNGTAFSGSHAEAYRGNLWLVPAESLVLRTLQSAIDDAIANYRERISPAVVVVIEPPPVVLPRPWYMNIPPSSPDDAKKEPRRSAGQTRTASPFEKLFDDRWTRDTEATRDYFRRELSGQPRRMP